MTLQELVPNILAAVKEAIGSSGKTDGQTIKKFEEIDSKVENVEDKVRVLREELQNMKEDRGRQKVLDAMEAEKNDQARRTDNVKILGVQEKDNENMKDLQEIIKDIGIKIIEAEPQNYFDVFRIGKKIPGKRRAILVKFSDCSDKSRLMAKKKYLKDSQSVKDDARFDDKVIILDDLTESRQKLLRKVKEMPITEFAFVKDGFILAKKRRGTSKFAKIENADDLFMLGADNVRFEEFYDLR